MSEVKTMSRAGRKKKFSPKETERIIFLSNAGVTVAEIAKIYETTRMTIYNYIKKVNSTILS